MFSRSAVGLHHVTTRAVSAAVFLQPRYGSSCTISSSASATGGEGTSRRRLPVGVFIDLDNVAPKTISRADVKKFTDPLREFAQAAGDVRVFRAFANTNTATWETPYNCNGHNGEGAEDLWLDGIRFDQEFIPWDEQESICQTGFDDENDLRCGVCGAKMKLSKADIKRGLTLFDKLNRHMKQLHDREQEKRKTRLNMKFKKGKKKPKWAKLSAKEMKQYHKYRAAQVGLQRTPASRKKKGKQTTPTMNDLFQILREEKVRCKLSNDVDSSIIDASQNFMRTINQGHNSSSCASEDETVPSTDGDNIRGVLCVVSEDSDFSDLLTQKSFITVAATPNSTKQTAKLAQSCDIVLCKEEEDLEDIDCIDDTVEIEFGPLIARPVTRKGEDLLEEIEGLKYTEKMMRTLRISHCFVDSLDK